MLHRFLRAPVSTLPRSRSATALSIPSSLGTAPSTKVRAVDLRAKSQTAKPAYLSLARWPERTTLDDLSAALSSLSIAPIIPANVSCFINPSLHPTYILSMDIDDSLRVARALPLYNKNLELLRVRRVDVSDYLGQQKLASQLRGPGVVLIGPLTPGNEMTEIVEVLAGHRVAFTKNGPMFHRLPYTWGSQVYVSVCMLKHNCAMKLISERDGAVIMDGRGGSKAVRVLPSPLSWTWDSTMESNPQWVSG